MGKKRAERQEQPTIWDIPDDVWPCIHTVLDEDSPAKPKGHRRVELRRVLHGSICRVRTGCHWHQLPTPLGDDSTGRRHCQRWCQRGILARLGAVLVESGDEWGGLAMASRRPRQGQRPPGGRLGRPPPHGPRETGVTRRLVVEAEGGPLGATMAGAKVHDTTLLAATLEAIVVERPQPPEERPQPRGRDKGDDHPTGHETVAASQDTPPIRRMGEDKRAPHGEPTSPARRWVVERTRAWLSKYRGLLVRDEKKAVNCVGLRQLACALIWMRRRARLVSD
jgi:putative transposase